MSITNPAEEYFKDGLWGWDSGTSAWVKLPVDDEGYLKVSLAMADISGAPFVTTAADGDLTAETVLGTGIIMSGTNAARPSALVAGRIYFETDTLKLFRDSGSAWEEISVREADELKATGATDDYVLTADGANECAFEVIPTQGFYDAYVCVRDKKVQNTAGGTFTQDAWRTRDINDEQADPDNICVIATNQITLLAGSYRAHIAMTRNRVDQAQGRLYDITGSAVLLLGLSQEDTGGFDANFTDIISGRFTLSEESALEIQHYCSVTCETDGFGRPGNITDEIYLIAEFWREQ